MFNFSVSRKLSLCKITINHCIRLSDSFHELEAHNTLDFPLFSHPIKKNAIDPLKLQVRQTHIRDKIPKLVIQRFSTRQMILINYFAIKLY